MATGRLLIQARAGLVWEERRSRCRRRDPLLDHADVGGRGCARSCYLIDNALRYGKGRAPAMLTVEITRQATRIGISVADSGPGLDVGQRESLRQRWAQGLAGVRLGAGTGLGLAIASRYGALMGGELVLEPGPGPGLGGKSLCAVVRLQAA